MDLLIYSQFEPQNTKFAAWLVFIHTSLMIIDVWPPKLTQYDECNQPLQGRLATSLHEKSKNFIDARRSILTGHGFLGNLSHCFCRNSGFKPQTRQGKGTEELLFQL